MESSLLLERSRSTSTSSHVSTQSSSSTSNNSSNYSIIHSPFNQQSINNEVDNELAEAANALTALGILRNHPLPPSSTTSINSNNNNNSNRNGINRPNNNNNNTSSRSASITSQGSWSQSGPSNSTGATSPTGYGAESELLLPEGRDQSDNHLLSQEDPNFISRVSQLPLVSGGLEWYERSKANSRVVKYGAGLVESSFSAVSRPLANNLQLNSLDEFACRQLDRLGASTSTSTSVGPNDSERRISIDGGMMEDRTGSTLFGEQEEESVRGRQNFDSNLIKRRESTSSSNSGQYRGNELIPLRRDNEGRMESPVGRPDQTVVVASRSRWQSVLVEAGGLGAAVSVESLKSLRYCLQWLLYATAHLDHQITLLRDFILSLHQHYGQSTSIQADLLASASASAHLISIKHDVVQTIRKVVEVVSKYAGAALPEQAKKYVRQSILGLPVKWASAVEGGAGGVGGREKERERERRGSVGTASSAGTPRAERMEDPRVGLNASVGVDEKLGGEGSIEHREIVEVEGLNSTTIPTTTTTPNLVINPALRPTEDAAERVLTFAVESLDMLKSVTQIFGESVEKAEAWIERLRIVGLDRQRQRQAAQSTSTSGSPPPPSTSDSISTATGTKRRRGIPLHDDPTSLSTSTDTVGGDAEESETLVRRRKGARNTTREAAIPMDC